MDNRKINDLIKAAMTKDKGTDKKD